MTIIKLTTEMGRKRSAWFTAHMHNEMRRARRRDGLLRRKFYDYKTPSGVPVIMAGIEGLSY